jgi:hypothetical protein
MHPTEPQGTPPPGGENPPPYGTQPTPPYGSQPAMPDGGHVPPPPYAYPPPRRTNSMAIAAMVVSLASLFTCPLVGAVGIYLGNRARAEIRRTGEEGDGMAQAGVIVGWIAIAFSVLYLCFFAGVFGIGFGAPLLFA